MSDRWPQWPSDRPPPRLRDGFLVERRAVGLIISTGLISIVLNITATLLIARAIDQALGQGARTADVSRAYRSAALAALAYATGGVFWITQGRITTRFVHRFANRIRIQADELIGGTRLVDLKRFGPTDIHGRLTNDVENLTRALQSSVSQLSNSLILTVGLIGVMLWVSPLLAAVTVGTVAIGIVLTRRITALARPLYGKEFGSLGALNSTVLEWLGADAPTRAMLRRARHTERLDELAAQARLNSFRAQRVGGLAQPLSLVVSYGGYLLVIIIGVFELRAGRITVGALQAMLLYARQVSGPLFQLAALSNLIQSGLASWGRVAELGGVRGVDGTPDRARASAPPASVERLVIEGVSLAYTDASDALSDIDLTLQRGDVMFLVGETGSGKSTLGAHRRSARTGPWPHLVHPRRSERRDHDRRRLRASGRLPLPGHRRRQPSGCW